LKKKLAKGRSDNEILGWITKKANHRRTAAEIELWSAHQERRSPDNPDSRACFNELHKACAPKRTDIVSWFNLLDADDFASYAVARRELRRRVQKPKLQIKPPPKETL